MITSWKLSRARITHCTSFLDETNAPARQRTALAPYFEERGQFGGEKKCPCKECACPSTILLDMNRVKMDRQIFGQNLAYGCEQAF